MSGERTPGVGEKVKNHVQGGETVQEIGAMLWNGANWVPATSGNTKDAEQATEVLPVQNLLLNQAGTMDRQRNNTMNEVALPLEARTVTTTSGVFTNFNFSKIHVRLEATEVGTGTLKLNISSDVGVIAQFVGLTPEKNISYLYQMGSGLETAAIRALGASPGLNMQSANAFLPGKFCITVVKSDASSWTYTVVYGLTL